MTIATATHTDTMTWISDAPAALELVEALYGEALESVRARVTKDGKLSNELIEQEQHAAHGLAWLATYVQGLRELLHYAERLSGEGAYGEIEDLLTRVGFAEYLAQVFGGIPMSQGEIVRLSDFGLSGETIARRRIPAIDRSDRRRAPRRKIAPGLRSLSIIMWPLKPSARPASTKRWRPFAARCGNSRPTPWFRTHMNGTTRTTTSLSR